MRVEKRGRSSWRVQAMHEGVRHSITFDHRPTQKEITIALAERYGGGGHAASGTVGEAALKYISSRRERGLSPTTLSAYSSIVRNTPAWFSKAPLRSLSGKSMQRLADELSEGRSPKTVSNAVGFYSSVLAESRPSFRFSVSLPKRARRMRYEPSTEDVRRLVEASRGTRYGTFMRLAALGLRRGEICALTADDLSEDGVLTVCKDTVKGEDNKYVVKDVPKTSASNRRILIPASLADEIRRQGYVYKGSPHSPNEFLHSMQDALGIPRFPLHTLRHFAAAYLNKRGFTREQILEYCGWERGSSVMERVYSYNLDPEESQKDIAGAFDGVI